MTREESTQSGTKLKEEHSRKLRELAQMTESQQSEISSLMSRLANK